MTSQSHRSPASSLRFTPLERLAVAHPVARIPYFVQMCAGLRVLDLGAMDETAWQSKKGRGTWLHEELARTALQVTGVDNSDAIPPNGLETGPKSHIRRGNVMDPAGIVSSMSYAPDVIVAGELIEHLENPLEFLRRFANARALSGRILLLSTPNATALHNVLVGFASRESTHRDHLCILSFKTLTTLCERAGFRDWEIIPYYSRFTEMIERHSGISRLAVRLAERLINVLEWMFPLLSFGYIVRVRL